MNEKQTDTPEGVKSPQPSFDEWWKKFSDNRLKTAKKSWRDE